MPMPPGKLPASLVNLLATNVNTAEARTKQALAKEVQRLLPQFQAKGRLLFLTPVDYLLRGVLLDASDISKNLFYPTAFVQPLYGGSDYIFFTFGGRLRDSRNRTKWDIGDEEWSVMAGQLAAAIKEQALTLFEHISTPLDLALACDSSEAFAPHFHWVCDDIHVMETAAQSWLLAGNTRKSLECSQKIQHVIASSSDRRDWVLALNGRAQRLEELLSSEKEDFVRRELNIAAKHSAETLGLSRWAAIPEF